VESVIAQNDLPEPLEVIVINDSGTPLPPEKWQKSDCVTVVATMKRERCVARNAGAAMARGRYLHFLDDDDYMLPGAFRMLYEAARGGDAHYINGLTKFTDGVGRPTRESRPGPDGLSFVQAVAGPWLPLQASLVKTETFFKAGGFDPRFSRMGEQKDLIRRVARIGTFAAISLPVSCVIQDHAKSTADWTTSNFQSVRSRDFILDEPGSFELMLKSATTPYWRGKAVRAYLTCVLWQMRKRNPFKMVHRASCAASAAARFLFSMRSGDFWRALIREK
jgi:hypothetical protein